MPKPIKSTGAPANAKLLESHAADAEAEVVKIKTERLRLQEAVAKLDGDPEKQKPFLAQLSDLPAQLEKAYELWFKLSKQVLDYDKKVDTARREGETILVTEAKEYYRQMYVGSILGVEAFILRFCQDAVGMDTPEAIYKAGAESIRQAHTASIEQAKREGVIPKWIDATPI